MKPKKLFIHIGMPKTGSSAIQALLALNPDYLRQQHFEFPWPPKFGQAYQTSAGNAAHLHEWIVQSGAERFNKAISNLDSSKVVLSSEILFHTVRLHPEKFSTFFSSYDVKVICYIRKMDDFLESCVNQLVKNHGLIDYSNLSPIIKEHDYATTLLNLVQHMAPERIEIRKYDRDTFVGGNIYSDFAASIGLDLNSNNKEINWPGKVINPSFDFNTFQFRRLLNDAQFDINDNELRYQTNGILAEFSVQADELKVPFIEYSEKENILKEFSKKEIELSKMFRGVSETYFSTKPTSAGSPPKEYSPESIGEILRFVYRRNPDTFFKILDGTIASFNNNRANQLMVAIRTKFLPTFFSEDHSKEEQARVLAYITSILPPVLLITGDNFHRLIHRKSKDIAGISRTFSSGFIVEANAEDPYFSIAPVRPSETDFYVVKICVSVTHDTTLQLFYQTHEQRTFTRFCSELRKIQIGYNEVSVVISNKQFNGNIRIDPGMHQGEYIFHSIAVFAETDTSSRIEEI